jgi:hypothetical protein
MASAGEVAGSLEPTRSRAHVLKADFVSVQAVVRHGLLGCEGGANIDG